MANIIKRVWNQNRMVQIEDLKGMTFQAEQAGHTFQISGIDDDGNTVALTGTPSGVLLRPDNTDVALTCSVSGGVVSATLPANCYDVPGRFGMTIFITSGSSKTAIYAAVGTVTRTSSGTVAPGTSQSVVDLINAINAAVNSIPASYSALLADIAPTYSNSALYSVGQYAWYDGDLKRCIVPITTAESYTAAHWTSAVLGQDVSDLKSALYQFIDVDVEQGAYSDQGQKYDNSTRLRTKVPIFVGVGSVVTIEALNGYEINYVQLNSSFSSGTLNPSWITHKSFITTAPYLAFMFRKGSSGADYSPSEYSSNDYKISVISSFLSDDFKKATNEISRIKIEPNKCHNFAYDNSTTPWNLVPSYNRLITDPIYTGVGKKIVIITKNKNINYLEQDTPSGSHVNSGLGLWTTGIEYTTTRPYQRFVFKKPDSANITPDFIVPDDYLIYVVDTINIVKVSSDAFKTSDLYETGSNLLDANSFAPYYINVDGSLRDSFGDASATFGFVSCQPQDVFSFYSDYIFMGVALCWYSSSLEFLSRNNFFPNTSDNVQATAPSNAAYMRLAILTNETDGDDVTHDLLVQNRTMLTKNTTEKPEYNDTFGCCIDYVARSRIKNLLIQDFTGKRISLLGDSITTFGGSVSDPDAARYSDGTYTYEGNRCRYPQSNLLTNVHDTYWMRLIDKLGMVLGINESWAGSRVSNTQATDSGDLGPNRCISSATRIGHLDDNGTPDIILVNAGTNDIGGNVTIGTFNTESPMNYTDEQIAALPVDTFANAYRTMLIRLQKSYPTSMIVCMLPNYTSTLYTPNKADQYCEIIKEACDYFGVKWYDIRTAGITMFNKGAYLPDGIHPNSNGMRLIYQELLKDFLYDVTTY